MIITEFSQAKRELLEIEEECKKTSQLDNSVDVEKVITRLVEFSACNQCPIIQLLQDKDVSDTMRSLRTYMARAEFYLEHEYAKKICASNSPRKVTRSYPFHEDYIGQSRFEYHSLSAVSPKPIRNILFIGAGPLSMTSICLATQNDSLRVRNIDIDQRATLMCQQVVEKLGLEKRVSCSCSDVMLLSSLKGYDAVILAVLVGDTPEEKSNILRHLSKIMESNQLLLVRTATGSGRFLYPSISPEEIVGFEVLSTTKLRKSMVNERIIVRKA